MDEDDFPWKPQAGEYGPIILSKVIPEGPSAAFDPLPEGAIRITVILPDFEIGRDHWAHLMHLLERRQK